MDFDFTINIPTLLTVAGVLVTVTAKVVRLEERVASNTRTLEAHCAEDGKSFERINERLGILAVNQALVGQRKLEDHG